MINTLLGTKKGMTSTYDARGRRVGATVVELGPNFVTQIKSMDSSDKYNGVQIGYGHKKSVRKPQRGLFQKIGAPEGLAHLREIRFRNQKSDVSRRYGDPDLTEGVQVGQEIKVGDVFKTGDSVKVTGVSKGRGFQGGVRRHGFHGGPKTHGQSDRHRAPGSVGSGTTPGRVFKGKKMAGHMGNEQVSYTGLEVVAIDRANNLITIKGGVPGPIGSLVVVQKQGVIKGYTPPPEPEPEEEEEASDKGQETNGGQVEGEQIAESGESGEAKDEAQETAAEQTEEVVESESMSEDGSSSDSK
jgi:large subunit ribosomal protein L3